jgi:CRP/FNR family transcriptional regulator, dissimilatory nitrate respiration regulator
MSAIFQCQLFNGFTLHEINQFLRRFSIETITYQKGDSLVNKNEPVNAIGIIESGEVEEIGKGLLHKAGNTFGENLLFAKDSTYPSQLVATSTTQVLYLKKDQLVQALSSYSKFLHNYLTVLSYQAQSLTEELSLLSQASIRDKIIAYIKSIYKGDLTVPIGTTKEELAKRLNVKRPSLSRELIYMRMDGILSTDRKNFYILKPEYFG